MLASPATPHKSKQFRHNSSSDPQATISDRYPMDSNSLEYLQSRLLSLTKSFPSHISNICDPTISQSSLHSPKDNCFSSTFSASMDDKPTIIDAFAPIPFANDLSPTSSVDSDLGSSYLASRSSFDTFVATRSRVIRLYNLPLQAEGYLSALFLPQSDVRCGIPTPISIWTVQKGYLGFIPDSAWAVFQTHEEAVTALSSISSSALSVTTALESDLEPFHKLRRFTLATPMPSLSPRATSSQPQLRVSSSHPNLQASRTVYDHTPGMVNREYPISSNPPNPRTSFRQGDWICNSPNCAAHNFGRNLTCIGCGCTRLTGEPNSNPTITPQQQAFPPPRNNSSPRFASFPSQSISLPNPPVQSPFSQQAFHTYGQLKQPHASRSQHNQPALTTSSVPPPRSTHPLLTPSGRSFAVGGRVQNISSDPLTPCIMYWPDNEPFPEQGQIRPSGLVGVAQPPILNTGNKGPIAHQPGDWICQKCNYLNWRRRKVCQTCLPYAEGNGDSISAAVQAERIALLTSVLAHQNQAQSSVPQAPVRGPRSHSMTPPQQCRPFVDNPPAQLQRQTHVSVHRSQSHLDLGAQYHNRVSDSTPIYQTAGNRQRQQPSPLYSTGPDFNSLPIHSPAPLLPSFLQDIVQSPALSPTSTSSADLSIEEYEEMQAAQGSLPRTPNNDDKATDVPHGNIWRLDGEESKSLSVFALHNTRGLLGSNKKASNDCLRLNQLVIS